MATVQVRAQIVAFRRAEGASHTEYEIRVALGTDEWTVHRRYSDFHALHASLSVERADVQAAVPLPPKRIFGNRVPTFLSQRQSHLQTYLSDVVRSQLLLRTPEVRRFLELSNGAIDAPKAHNIASTAVRGAAATPAAATPVVPVTPAATATPAAAATLAATATAAAAATPPATPMHTRAIMSLAHAGKMSSL